MIIHTIKVVVSIESFFVCVSVIILCVGEFPISCISTRLNLGPAFHIHVFWTNVGNDECLSPLEDPVKI